MKALLLDPVQNLARLEDFPMIDRPQICRRCNFRRLCFPPAAEVKERLPLDTAAGGAAKSPPDRAERSPSG